ncbi:MAG: hypothetical protein WCK67_07870 [bacterium]
MEQYLPYAAIIVAVFSFFTQFGIFVRPEQLEKKHREILEDAEKKFATHTTVNDLKCQLANIGEKVDSIYKILLAKVGGE